MDPLATQAEPTVVRRVFEAWSIEIPASFAETFVDEDSYWHAYDEHRSVSMTSVVLTDKRGPVSAHRIVRHVPLMDGDNIEDLPAGLVGRAVTADAVQPARAARVLSGILAAKGRLLLVTITSNDLDWACKTWLSIVAHRASFQPRHQRRTGSGRRGCP